MKSLRTWMLALIIVALVPAAGYATIQTQRAQIAVTVIVDVTPAPLARVAPGVPAPWMGSVAFSGGMHAESLQFSPTLVAQATPTPASVKVEAEVSPNPAGTLLTSDQNAVEFPATAGTTVTKTCAYHITVSTTSTNWQLKDGVYTDFSSSFPGSDLANNTYLSAPSPAPTPFVVYATDGHNWALRTVNSGKKTYCVDLSVTVPAAVPQGSYSTNAIYTVYF